MSEAATTSGGPVEQLRSLMKRTLWIAFGAFCVSILVCGAIVVATRLLMGGDLDPGLAEMQQPPQNWGQWQFFFAAIGLVCVYLMHRLGGVLLRPARFWQGTRNLAELAQRLDEKRSKTNAARGPATQHSEEERRHMLSRAVQHLFSRIILVHILLWAIAEVPVLLGLVDQFVSGNTKFFTGMFLLSALALAIRRPSGARLQQILAPLQG